MFCPATGNHNPITSASVSFNIAFIVRPTDETKAMLLAVVFISLGCQTLLHKLSCLCH